MSWKKKTKLERVVPVFDSEGWAKADLYKPEDFELVLVEDDKGKRQHGWYTGQIWEFGIKRIAGEIVAWKRSEY